MDYNVKSKFKIIRTPLDTLNILCGGGVRQGTILEAYGGWGSGKSAFCYQCASYFLQDNPDGRIKVIDPESSAVDEVRLRHTFGWDLSRVDIVGARTLEDGFHEITKSCRLTKSGTIPERDIVKMGAREFKKLIAEYNIEADLAVDNKDRKAEIKKLIAAGVVHAGEGTPVPTLIIWDSIAASKPRLEVEASDAGNDAMNSGGMGLRARVIEQELAICSGQMYGKPITLFLINQIRTTGFGTYQGPHNHYSSGGNALKHFDHYLLYFNKKKPLYDEKKRMSIGTVTVVSVEKAKFCPTTRDIQINIDDTLGGRIVPNEETPLICLQLGLLTREGKMTYRFIDEWLDKNTPAVPNAEQWSWEEITSNDSIREKCIDKIARHYRRSYFTLDILYKELGINIGNFPDEERATLWQQSRIKLDQPTLSEDEQKEILDPAQESSENVGRSVTGTSAETSAT